MTEYVTAVHPEPDMVQLLTPEGLRVQHPDYPLEISDDEIGALYRDMILVRRFDAEATALQRQGELGLWASCLGQEAAQIGAGRAVRPQDMIFPTYREHGVAWCRGMDPLVLMGLYRGSSVGSVVPRESNFNMYTIVIGAQTLHAAGYAMGVVRDGAVGSGDPARDTAVLTFFGDGASSQGDVNESFVWAAAENLPMVYLCQNNQWAISAPVTTQSRVPLYLRSAGFGFPGVRVDGNDVLACLAVTRKSLDDARNGQGPTLIEAFTYRMGPHTSSDDPSRYRLAAEVETWKLKDPIARVRSYLTRSAGFGSHFFDNIEAEADAVAEHVRSGTRALPDPTTADLFEHVYVNPPPGLLAQREEFAEFLESVGGGSHE
jgi:2-oxoisovalerate dehydrogenase E1 component alpha subunit